MKQNITNRQDAMEWWREKSKEYPFHAFAPTAIKPPAVKGEHASIVVRTGWRKWGWKTQEERDLFVLQYNAKLELSAKEITEVKSGSGDVYIVAGLVKGQDIPIPGDDYFDRLPAGKRSSENQLQISDQRRPCNCWLGSLSDCACPPGRPPND